MTNNNSHYFLNYNAIRNFSFKSVVDTIDPWRLTRKKIKFQCSFNKMWWNVLIILILCEPACKIRNRGWLLIVTQFFLSLNSSTGMSCCLLLIKFGLTLSIGWGGVVLQVLRSCRPSRIWLSPSCHTVHLNGVGDLVQSWAVSSIACSNRRPSAKPYSVLLFFLQALAELLSAQPELNRPCALALKHERTNQ